METKSYTVDKAAILKLNSNSSVDNSNLYTSNNILVFKITYYYVGQFLNKSRYTFPQIWSKNNQTVRQHDRYRHHSWNRTDRTPHLAHWPNFDYVYLKKIGHNSFIYIKS